MASELFKKAITRIDPKDREITLQLFNILSGLKVDGKDFKAKVDIIDKLIKEPKSGHVVDKFLVKWLRKVGLKPELNYEDGISWWIVYVK